MAKTKKTPAKKTAKTESDPTQTYQDIKALMILIDDDLPKFLVDENRSAGTRVRGNAMTIIKLCKKIRLEIMEVVNARKV